MKEFFATLFLLILSSFSTAADPDVFPDPARFPVPAGYEKNVEFWTRVYGEWHDNQAVIHDSENMDVVFDVIDLPDENSLLRSVARANLADRISQIQRILRELDADKNACAQSEEHRRICDLYKNNYDPDKYRKAISNLRVQQGIKDRFEHGLELMTRYIDQIKEVFRQEGLPEEIAFLPLVESSFNNQSLSKTRAAGIWQFMPGTARLYMKVNYDLDERLDPYVASRAAARYLKRSYQMFGNWPVSLMSYNHGQAGIAQAVRQVGNSDFMTILTHYDGRLFGFASRNFYGEFVAACRVMHDAPKYFDNLQYEKPLTHNSITLSRPLYVSTIVNSSDLSQEDLRTYNPALQSSVLFSRRPIPTGYQLRLPASSVKDPEAFIAKMRTNGTENKEPESTVKPKPAQAKASVAKASAPSSSRDKKTYVVRRGDTLFSISLKFDTTVDAIQKLNGLNHSRIVVGQVLHVPAR